MLDETKIGKEAFARTETDVDESLFRTHFDELPSAAYIWRRIDDDFHLVAHNHAGRHIGDSDASQLIGLTARELHHGRPDIVDALHRCADEGETIHRETDLRLVTGATRRVVATYVLVAPNTVVVHANDVTDRVAAEQALEDYKHRTQALFTSNPDSVFRVTIDGTILDAHSSGSCALPFEPEAMIGKNLADVAGADTLKAHRQQAAAAVRTGKVQILERRFKGPDADLFVEFRFVASGPDEVVVNARDVTNRVQLERELLLVGERERNRLGQEIHDGLAQILTGLKLTVETLAHKLREENSRYSPDAERAAALLNHTVAEARDLARGLNPMPSTTLSEGLQDLSRHVESFFGSVRCQVACTNPFPKLLEFAEIHLYRIAQEAITNAVKHGQASAVSVHCRTDDDQLVLRIEDNGPGFSEGERSGGLGMRIMRHRARSIGGDLEIGSAAAGGTSIVCTAPLSALT